MKKRSIALIAMACSALASIQAAEMTADEIVEKANLASYYAGEDGRSSVKMTISDGRTREFTILRKNVEAGGDQMFYVFFRDPADVRNMSYLVHKKAKGDDDRWLYLPALNLVRRIAPGDVRTSFVGSDFLYEDVSGRSLALDQRELIETSEEYYVIRNVPHDPNSVEFTEFTAWIRRDNFLPVKAEYLDRNGKVYRRVAAEEIETVDGYPVARKQIAEDLNSGSKTVLHFEKIEFDVGLNERIFTERFLRRPPREVTR